MGRQVLMLRGRDGTQFAVVLQGQEMYKVSLVSLVSTAEIAGIAFRQRTC